MNKKILIFLVVALGALSIMAISIWGTLAESNALPPIATLEITDFDQTNNSGEKILFVKGIITEEEYTYRINFVASPGDADQDGIKAKVDIDSGVQVISSIAEHYVVVIFEPSKIGKAVTVTVWDIKTMKEDSVTLLFATESEVDIDDPDVFE
jgi:hypothetical protein